LALIAVFAVAILLAFHGIRDLLAVRGLAILAILLANFTLDSIYCEPVPLRGVLALIAYLIVVSAMIIGAAPYLFVSFSEFLLKSTATRIALAAFFAFGAAIFAVASIGAAVS
jgi:hypothetical protein